MVTTLTVRTGGSVLAWAGFRDGGGTAAVTSSAASAVVSVTVGAMAAASIADGPV